MNNFFINGIVKDDSLKNAFSIGFFGKNLNIIKTNI